MKIETLKKLVVPREALYRDLLKEPWQINFSGVEYTLATNGRIMIIVRNTTNEFRPLDADGCKKALTYLQEPLGGVDMPLSKVKDWAGPYVPDQKEDCARCKGTGRVFCPGGRACECSDDLELLHTDPEKVWCAACDGSGSTIVSEVRLGQVAHLQINRNQIAQVLETVEDDRVNVCCRQWSLTLTGESWRAWIMGFYKPSQEPKEPIPVLDYPEAGPSGSLVRGA